MTADGRLVPRAEPGAVLHEEADVVARVVELAARVQSLCVHGDTPGAAALARAVRRGLEAAGIEVRPFAGGCASRGSAASSSSWRT